MKKRTIVILSSVVMALAFAAGYQMAPKAEVKTEIVEVEKVREKVKTVTVVVEKPGGEKITTIKEDRSTDTDTGRETKIDITRKSSEWLIGMSYTPEKTPVYGAHVQRRVFGNIFLGGFINSKSEYGILATFEF